MCDDQPPSTPLPLPPVVVVVVVVNVVVVAAAVAVPLLLLLLLLGPLLDVCVHVHSTPACTDPRLIEKSCRGPGGVGLCMPQLDLSQLLTCHVQVVHHRHVDTHTSSWHHPQSSSKHECEIETLRNSSTHGAGVFLFSRTLLPPPPGPLTHSTPSCKEKTQARPPTLS